MEGVIAQANEQRMNLQRIVTQRKELEKLVALKEKKLQVAKARNCAPEFQAEGQDFRILQGMGNHKQKVAELELLRRELESLAMHNIQAKDKQKVRLEAHKVIMKDLAEKFQFGPQTYMDQIKMKDDLNHLEKGHQAMKQNVASVVQELDRKKATFRQLCPVDPIQSNTITVDGNMALVMQKISKVKQLELKQSKAKEHDLQKKLNNLQQLNSLYTKRSFQS